MTRYRFWMLAAVPLLGLGAAVLAQTPSRPHIVLGKTTVDADEITFKPHTLDTLLVGNVVLKSPDYDLKASRVKAYGASGGANGEPSVVKVVATGSADGTEQVLGHFDQTDQDRQYTMQADQVTYTPDPSRSNGATIDLTGHPKVTTVAPKQLAEPSVTTADHIVILLGDGDDYPEVQAEKGHMTFTPLHTP